MNVSLERQDMAGYLSRLASGKRMKIISSRVSEYWLCNGTVMVDEAKFVLALWSTSVKMAYDGDVVESKID